MTAGTIEIAEGIHKEYVDDALLLSYHAFAKKFRIGFRDADDLVRLFGDAVDRSSCLTAMGDGGCLGILTYQTTERDFYHLKLTTLLTRFSPVRALRMLVNSVLLDDRAKGGEFLVASLVVSPSARGLGLGTALLERAEGTARDLGKSRMALSVIGENEGAIRLYERLGYRTAHRRTGFLIRLAVQSEEVRRMEKPLSGQGDEVVASGAS